KSDGGSRTQSFSRRSQASCSCRGIVVPRCRSTASRCCRSFAPRRTAALSRVSYDFTSRPPWATARVPLWFPFGRLPCCLFVLPNSIVRRLSGQPDGGDALDGCGQLLKLPVRVPLQDRPARGPRQLARQPLRDAGPVERGHVAVAEAVEVEHPAPVGFLPLAADDDADPGRVPAQQLARLLARDPARLHPPALVVLLPAPRPQEVVVPDRRGGPGQRRPEERRDRLQRLLSVLGELPGNAHEGEVGRQVAPANGGTLLGP